MVLPSSLKQTLDNLPEQPGVYRLRDLRGKILYVGKSRSLRDRVRTYFHHSPRNRKTRHLRALTKSIDYLVFETDHQAQEAEWDLIRAHRPEYNTLFLDYWNRPYVRLTVDDPYPRIELTQTREDDGAEYYGPYRSTRRLRTMLFALRETYPIRDCGLNISAGGDPSEHERCVEAHLGRCTAPCVGEESVGDYRDRLNRVRDFLRGDYGVVLDELESKMDQAASAHNYEAASIYRDRLQAVRNLVHYEPFIRETLDLDVWGRHADCLVKLTIREHRLKDFRVFDDVSHQRECLEDYYRGGGVSVDVLAGDGVSAHDLSQLNVLGEFNEEHQSLLDAAERTARLRAREPEPIGGTVTDRVRVRSDSIRLRRQIDSESQERTVAITDPRSVLKSTVIPIYRADLDSGRILPEQVFVNLEKSLTLDDDGLFRETQFWFPIILE